MRIRNMSRCLRVTSVVGLICPASVIAVPPPGARSAQGLTIARQITATQPLSMNSAPAGVSTTGGDAFGVTLLSHVPVADFGGGSTGSNDCWGYVSPSGREYALIGNQRGLGIAEVTNPTAPVVLTEIPHPPSTWSDMKVYDEYAYVVNENGGGLQVLDLRMIDLGIVTVAPANPHEFDRAHNVALNPDSGFVYPCGTSSVSGFIAYDLSDPANPQTFPGWFWNETYVHDVHFVNYDDCPYAGRSGPCEIAFASCGGAGLRIIDVTDKASMTTIASRTYPGLAYCHQSWTTEDGKYLLIADEADELSFGLPSTTYVFDVQNVANPTFVTTFTNGHFAIDHNLYVRGNFMYAANYAGGLRIFDVTDPPNAQEVGWYDTPSAPVVSYVGAWGVYPFLPRGTILISNMETGLYVFDVTQVTGCFIDANCDDSNSCTSDTCEADGSCSHADVASGDACEDGNNCTFNGVCNGAGLCESIPVDSIPCADDSACGLYRCGVGGFCECERCVSVLPAVVIDPAMVENRYLTVSPDNPGQRTALQVVFANLARPYDIYNGMRMWVTAPQVVSESGGDVNPVPDVPNFTAATLGCQPHFTDWGSLGSVSLYHPMIVPGSEYHVRVIGEACVIAEIDDFSEFVVATTSRFGDVVGDMTFTPPGPPDGEVVIADVLAVIGGFASVPGSARKTRTDLEPGTPDLLINISDVLVNLSAFAGVPYPFDPPEGPLPCP